MTALKQNPEQTHTTHLSAGVNMQAIPAFYDLSNGNIYLSRYVDGSLAPLHVYDGLPDSVLMRNELNVVSGYLVDGQFLTNEQTFAKLSDLR